MAPQDLKKSDEEVDPLVSASSLKVLIDRTPLSNPALNKTLFQVLPKWWSVARLWFIGELTLLGALYRSKVQRDEYVVSACQCPAGEEKLKACTLAAVAIFLSLVRILMMVQISYVQRNFETALAGKDKGA